MKKYTKQELIEALEDWVDSCHRTGLHDERQMAREFCRENNHMGVDYYEVLDIIHDLEHEFDPDYEPTNL